MGETGQPQECPQGLGLWGLWVSTRRQTVLNKPDTNVSVLPFCHANLQQGNRKRSHKAIEISPGFCKPWIVLLTNKKPRGWGQNRWVRQREQRCVTVWWRCLSLDTGNAHMTLSRRRSCVWDDGEPHMSHRCSHTGNSILIPLLEMKGHHDHQVLSALEKPITFPLWPLFHVMSAVLPGLSQCPRLVLAGYLTVFFWQQTQAAVMYSTHSVQLLTSELWLSSSTTADSPFAFSREVYITFNKAYHACAGFHLTTQWRWTCQTVWVFNAVMSKRPLLILDHWKSSSTEHTGTW